MELLSTASHQLIVSLEHLVGILLFPGGLAVVWKKDLAPPAIGTVAILLGAWLALHTAQSKGEVEMEVSPSRWKTRLKGGASFALIVLGAVIVIITALENAPGLRETLVSLVHGQGH